MPPPIQYPHHHRHIHPPPHARSCFDDGQYEQAIGIALESRRLDKLEEAIRRCGDRPAILEYSLRTCQKLVAHRQFREQVLLLLVKLYETLPNPNWVVVCECLTFLGDAKGVATILDALLKGSEVHGWVGV